MFDINPFRATSELSRPATPVTFAMNSSGI